jgi:hypothetical protein
VAGVYESLRADGIWFLTQERPSGLSLADMSNNGEQLSIPSICRIIAAAAEMYSLCYKVELDAMPLAASSIFVTPEGEVQFLSPLVEGQPTNLTYQQQSIAMALWQVCPRTQTPGLGRITTLLQWLNEGVEGRFLPWNDVRTTALTILGQLYQESAKTTIQDEKPRSASLPPFIKATQKFLTRWGIYIAGAAAIIIGMSSLGTLYGMADPLRIPTSTEEAVLCRDGNLYESVSKKLVTVSEYAKFLQDIKNMEKGALTALLNTLPDAAMELEPENWEQQRKKAAKKKDMPVTGINFWQASLYARFQGGRVVSAAQAQLVLQLGGETCPLEWTRTETASPLPGIYDKQVSLLINQSGKPVPVDSREWSQMNCGFRIAKPTTSH